ncbi:MAG: hypothetical protein JO127_11255 [Caulobacteraceae bacterium]|nr:hypothetical protein [Caulobacteraceae bacterium]
MNRRHTLLAGIGAAMAVGSRIDAAPDEGGGGAPATAPRMPTGPADGYPEGRYPDVRRMGQFNWLQISSFTVVPEDLLVSRRYCGFRHVDTWLDAFLVGESGTYYNFAYDVRSQPDNSISVGVDFGPQKSSPSGLVSDTRSQRWRGKITQTLTPDGRIVYAAPESPTPEEISFDSSSVTWTRANGDLKLQGSLAGRGSQWHNVWRKPDGNMGGMYMCHQWFLAEGRYFGEVVKGYVLLETFWSDEHYQDTWWVRNRVGLWGAFAINYEDGSSEIGQIHCGEFGARGAVIVDNEGREVVSTTNVNAFDDSELNAHVEFGDGQRLDFEGDRVRSMIFPQGRLLFGKYKRVGEKRKVRNACGAYLVAHHVAAPRPFR